jgi:hypothetical protein
VVVPRRGSPAPRSKFGAASWIRSSAVFIVSTTRAEYRIAFIWLHPYVANERATSVAHLLKDLGLSRKERGVPDARHQRAILCNPWIDGVLPEINDMTQIY